MSLVIKKDVCLKPYNSLGIGGRAKYFCLIKDRFQLRNLIKKARSSNIPCFIFGCGSNLFFSDKGFDGLVILNQIHSLEFSQSAITAGSGHRFSSLGALAIEKGFTGLEFSSTISGSIGGAIFMGVEPESRGLKDTLLACLVIDKKGKFLQLTNEQLELQSKRTLLQRENYYVVEASFTVKRKKTQQKRLKKPVENSSYKETRSASIFRDPVDRTAAQLIDSCGLKGKKIGGITISNEDANSFINLNNAASEEMHQMIAYVQKTVQEQTGYSLHSKVNCIQPKGESVV